MTLNISDPTFDPSLRYLRQARLSDSQSSTLYRLYRTRVQDASQLAPDSVVLTVSTLSGSYCVVACAAAPDDTSSFSQCREATAYRLRLPSELGRERGGATRHLPTFVPAEGRSRGRRAATTTVPLRTQTAHTSSRTCSSARAISYDGLIQAPGRECPKRLSRIQLRLPPAADPEVMAEQAVRGLK